MKLLACVILLDSVYLSITNTMKQLSLVMYSVWIFFWRNVAYELCNDNVTNHSVILFIFTVCGSLDIYLLFEYVDANSNVTSF